MIRLRSIFASVTLFDPQRSPMSLGAWGAVSTAAKRSRLPALDNPFPASSGIAFSTILLNPFSKSLKSTVIPIYHLRQDHFIMRKAECLALMNLHDRSPCGFARNHQPVFMYKRAAKQRVNLLGEINRNRRDGRWFSDIDIFTLDIPHQPRFPFDVTLDGDRRPRKRLIPLVGTVPL